VGEKNGSGAVAADQRFFLSEMGVVARYPGTSACLAYARITGQPIYGASSGAKNTGF
jgi:hypothetical protein